MKIGRILFDLKIPKVESIGALPRSPLCLNMYVKLFYYINNVVCFNVYVIYFYFNNDVVWFNVYVILFYFNNNVVWYNMYVKHFYSVLKEI